VIAVAWHRERYRPPAAEAFVELARELCRELEARTDGTIAAVA
jgi:DNA-binding transcriptional LysR family regulator